MLIQNKYLAAVWKLLAFVAAVMAVLLQCGLFGEKLNLSCLTYFTLMSNIACAVYFPIAAWHQYRTGHSWNPTAKGAILLCISVTGLVYHFMLNGRFEMQGTIMLSNVLLHYVVPIMTVLDWVLFDDKGFYSPKTALKWLLAPIGYFLFVQIAVAMGAHLGPYGAKYPYYFMDIETMGISTSLVTAIVMMGSFYLLGLFFVWVDNLLAKVKVHK